MSLLKNIKVWWTINKPKILRYKDIILAAVVIVLIFTVACLLRRPPKVVTTAVDNKDIVQKLEYAKDDADSAWGKVKALLLEKAEVEERSRKYAEALKLKPKYVQGAEQWHVRTDTIFKEIKTTVVNDTTYRIEKHDPYVDIIALAGKSVGSIQYSSRDTLNILHVVKNPLIGKTTRSTYISSSNPYNTIVSGYSYSVKEKKPYISIGPVVGFDIISKKPTVGIGVMFPIINFKR